MKTIQDLEPKALWQNFHQITQIPRPSGYEDKIREYIIKRAKEFGHQYQIDKAGNILIFLEAHPEKQSWPCVLIQNHIDMVCDAAASYSFDFFKEPIQTIINNGSVYANKTTLGADNGIGCAAALTLMEPHDFKLPALELLFTVDEESGLHGALKLDFPNLQSKIMLNLDSEEWGTLIIGCAGGKTYQVEKEFEQVVVPNSFRACKLSVSNLKGGHSGIDIHRSRQNALKFLLNIIDFKIDLRIVSISCGRAHNIIPRDAEIIFWLPQDQYENFQKTIDARFQIEFGKLVSEDQNIELEIAPIELFDNMSLSKDASWDVLGLLNSWPHGAYQFDDNFKHPVVSLSCNMAKVHLQAGKIFILSSARFFRANDIRRIEEQYESLVKKHNLGFKVEVGYPSWIPNIKSELVSHFCSEYQKLFGTELEVNAIHAGLECGIIGQKFPNMDMISFGPNIYDAHSPTERVDIESVEKFWRLLIHFLQQLK